jgi:hypothetical protein
VPRLAQEVSRDAGIDPTGHCQDHARHTTSLELRYPRGKQVSSCEGRERIMRRFEFTRFPQESHHATGKRMVRPRRGDPYGDPPVAGLSLTVRRKKSESRRSTS